MYSSYATVAAVCSCFFPTFASIAVVFRYRARKIKALAYGADDYSILIALVSTLLVRSAAIF